MRLDKDLFFKYDCEYGSLTYKQVLETIIKEHKNGTKASIKDVDKAVKFFEDEFV